MAKQKKKLLDTKLHMKLNLFSINV